MPQAHPYRRDAVTWTGFSLIGVWAFFLYFIGPASNAIGADLRLSPSAIGLLSTALAMGLTASAAVGPWAVGRWGRRSTLLLGLAAMAGLALLLAASPAYPMVLLAVLGLGLFGATLANTATATLSDHHHPRHRARAITEGNAAASWLGVAAPVVLGFFLALPMGWRGAAVVVGLVPLLAIPAVLRLPEAMPVREAGASRPGATSTSRMPSAFWPALVVVAMAVAMEFCVNFWAAALISERTGAELSAAATALSAMTLAMALGRTFAGSLPQRFEVTRLIMVFFVIAGAGLAALMLAPTYAWSVLALFATGVGLSVLFPFAQSHAIALASDRPDRAVAFTALAVGAAIAGAPFILGIIAGAVGLAGAFAVGFVLAALGICCTAAVVRSGDGRG